MSYIHNQRKEENARECIFSFFPFTVLKFTAVFELKYYTGGYVESLGAYY